MNINELMARQAMKDAGNLVDDMFDIPRGAEIEDGTVHITLPKSCIKFNASPEMEAEMKIIAEMNEFRRKIASHNINEVARYEDECFMVGKENARPPAVIALGIDHDDEDDWGDE